MIKAIIFFIIFVIVVTILDYANIPTHRGLNISNINWDFYMGMLNITSVLEYL